MYVGKPGMRNKTWEKQYAYYLKLFTHKVLIHVLNLEQIKWLSPLNRL